MSHPKKICLALQGGGAHGAFTWGVLDRFLQEEQIEIEGVTGTSAGGMNALCLAQGLGQNSRTEARQLLHDFWQSISETGQKFLGHIPETLDQFFDSNIVGNTFGEFYFSTLRRYLSPSHLELMNTHPLMEIIQGLFNFDIIRDQKNIKIYLCATHVQTGKVRVFKTHELTLETLLATACLPSAHPAVCIEGEYYWDGGLIGNPVLYPLIYECQSPDIIIVKLTPSFREKIPKTRAEINNRLFEITNNNTVAREMRAVAFVSYLIDTGQLDPTIHKRSYLHTIEDADVFASLGRASTLNTTWRFFRQLFDAGQKAATDWIDHNFDSLGIESTAHYHDHFLDDHWEKPEKWFFRGESP